MGVAFCCATDEFCAQSRAAEPGGTNGSIAIYEVHEIADANLETMNQVTIANGGKGAAQDADTAAAQLLDEALATKQDARVPLQQQTAGTSLSPMPLVDLEASPPPQAEVAVGEVAVQKEPEKLAPRDDSRKWPQADAITEIRIERQDKSEQLGVDLRHHKTYLLVSRIYAGHAVHRHNQRTADKKWKTLETGDRIVKVNGVEGDAELMTAACRDALVVTFHVVR
mmetsp:Transcript_19912/g.46334  ORF Transcript_19912/g.46334 Transcript_19912/m.46334 type:complete len:225 (-) Transcript_19912:210-884(-)